MVRSNLLVVPSDFCDKRSSLNMEWNGCDLKDHGIAALWWGKSESATRQNPMVPHHRIRVDQKMSIKILRADLRAIRHGNS
jgi:hypothetical protein